VGYVGGLMGPAEPLLSIGDVAARAGVRTSTLRYYEEEGLITPDRRVGGQRRFRSEAVEQLTVIRFCRALGFSLAEIRDMLAPPRGRAQKQRWRELVDSKLAELGGVIARAEAMAAILRASRDCACVDVRECAVRCSPLLSETLSTAVRVGDGEHPG
jgi:MerR family transcriptional regulator, redox-sensitive transcriptional activator SoxR